MYFITMKIEWTGADPDENRRTGILGGRISLYETPRPAPNGS